eukprot:gene6996-11162_t
MDYKNLGNIELQKGNYELAIEYFTKGINEEPQNHILYSNRSAAYLTMNKLTEALKDSETCVKIDPNFIKGYLRKANTLIEMEDLEKAKETLEEGLKIDSSNDKISKLASDITKVIQLKKSATNALTEKKFWEAIDLYTDALNYKIMSHVFYSNRSAVYCQIQNYSEAQLDALEVVKKKPKWVKGYLRLGNALMGLSNFGEAIKAFEKGLQIDSLNESLQKQLEVAKKKNSESNNYIKVNTDEEYIKLMNGNPGKLIVVDFYADWCGPCKQVAPYFKQFSTQYKNVIFLKVNVDELQRTSQQAGIRAMPSFLFMKDGKKVHFVEGANLQELQKTIEKFK